MYRLSKILKVAFIFAVFLSVPFFAFAQLPSIPGYTGPTQPDSIPALISYIYNFAFWIVGIAVFFNIFRAGFVIFFSAAGSASKVAEGRKILTNAIIGLILLFSSWLILNVINPDLVKNTFDFGQLLGVNTPVPTVTSQPPGGNSTSFACAGADGKYACSPGNKSDCSDSVGCAAGSSCQQIASNQCGQPVGGGTVVGANSCTIQQGVCANPSCAQYLPAINQYANGVATANMLKAIMMQESQCGENPTVRARQLNSSGAGGLMQFLIPTARIYAPRCGVSGTIDADWLTNPANFNLQICMAAKFFQDMASNTDCGSHGGDVTMQVIAGYNGGPSCTSDPDKGACCPSTTCTGPGCDNSVTRKWNCPQNSGFQQTRTYVAKVEYCIRNPGF